MAEEKEIKIHALMLLEVVGKPQEFLKETLEGMIKQISEEPKTKLINHKINEPIEAKDHKDFFTTFAEVEVEVDELMYLIALMFKYMPSYVEVINPEKITLTNNNWTEILSEVIRRLHTYDEIARTIQIEKSILERKLREVLDAKKNKSNTESTKREQDKKD